MLSALLSHSSSPEWHRDTQTETVHGQIQGSCKGLQKSGCSPLCSINYINGVFGPREWWIQSLPVPASGEHFHTISCSAKTGGDLRLGIPKATREIQQQCHQSRSGGDLVLSRRAEMGLPAFTQLCKTSSLLTSQLSLGKNIPWKMLASMG